MNNAKKMYFILIAVLVLMGVAIMSMLYLSRDYMASSEKELVAAKLEIIKLNATEEVYTENINNLKKYGNMADILKQVVPSEKDQAKAVRELNQIMVENGFKINTIAFQSSQLNKKTTVVKNPDPAVVAAPSVSQAKPVKGLQGVMAMDVNVQITSHDESPVTTNQILGMLHQIENNRRNMRVSSINFNAGEESVSIKLKLFIKP